MKQIQFIAIFIFLISVLFSCNEKPNVNSKGKKISKHHLNIPEAGIESMIEANTQKIIEGTDGSVIITIGDITRKKASISIKRNDQILDEKIVEEKSSLSFMYEDREYTIELKNLKKPLIGVGKAEILIK